MRRFIIAAVLTGTLSMFALPQRAGATDPITQAIIEGVKKVIRAFDIAVQRLQNATIRLQNAQKQVENLLNKLKLKEIYDWSKKQTDLFSGYYEELRKVKLVITYYKRIKDVVNTQVQVVKECQRAIRTVSKAGVFKPDEIIHMLDIYTGIMDQSLRNVEQLHSVIKSFATQMSDAERLALIHHASDIVESNLHDLRKFTNQNLMLGLQRIKDKTEVKTLEGLYNLP